MYGTETRYNDLRCKDIISRYHEESLVDQIQNLSQYKDIISTQSQYKQNIKPVSTYPAAGYGFEKTRSRQSKILVNFD